MNIFDQYGIKEVADVTIYSIHKKEDGSGDVYYVPALYLDTLKVTTTEKTASNVWAQGGLSNSRLICWDYGKEINFSITDALCTPASLGLCWGGILGSDWKDAHVKHTYGISYGDENPVKRLSRLEKAFYPRNDRDKGSISKLLPHITDDLMYDKENILGFSSIVDGTEVEGFGYCKNRPYKWRMAIESAVKSIAVIPNRFFSTLGKHYPLNIKQTVGINTPSDTFKYEIIYKRGLDSISIDPPKAMIIYNYEMEDGKPTSKTYSYDNENEYSSDSDQLNMLEDETRFPYLKIRVDNDNNYTAYFGTEEAMWLEDINKANVDGKENEAKWYPNKFVETEQFKQLDLWNRFDSINEMIYFLITKYEDNIWDIKPRHILPGIGGVKSNKITSTTFNKGYKFTYRIKNKSKITTSNASNKITSGDFSVTLKHKNDDDTYNKNYGEVSFVKTKEYKTSDNVVTNFVKIINSIFSTELTIDDIIFSNYSEPEIIYADRTKPDIRDDKKVDEAGIPFSNVEVDGEPEKKKGRLWCYVNPKTMTPYDDDYWFHQGQPYLKKSLTLSPNDKKLKAQKITIEAGVFPGMYKIVGETYIRQRETGEDERFQITFPLCKIKSDQTLTLEAEGDPTTFSLDVEVARPESGIMMEITTYDVEKEEETNPLTGKKYIKDGSVKVLSE